MFTTGAAFEAREHELRAHRAIADEPPCFQSFKQGGFHFGDNSKVPGEELISFDAGKI